MSYCELRKYLELIYFASGPIVAIGVFAAIISVHIAKKQYLKFAKDIDTKYSREIGRQAIDDITTFNRIVNPKYLIYGNELKSAGMMSFTYGGDITDLRNETLIKSAKSFSESISEKC